ncbi:CLUMA_CG006674, isoform A [Clunio marinus]|uniref:CLUMA_CG006674, isoform A n=1 Tax=Clunio marinus TaxID=568069 RepID=A0A1J1I2Q2_9DIPT|nr:CLUMA_CG006674, isoform A [Clunio marinus]
MQTFVKNNYNAIQDDSMTRLIGNWAKIMWVTSNLKNDQYSNVEEVLSTCLIETSKSLDPENVSLFEKTVETSVSKLRRLKFLMKTFPDPKKPPLFSGVPVMGFGIYVLMYLLKPANQRWFAGFPKLCLLVCWFLFFAGFEQPYLESKMKDNKRNSQGHDSQEKRVLQPAIA